MNITINQVLQSYIDPLTASEYAALERSLLAEGCRDALVLWNDVLIDGHNRYAICRQHGIEFKTIQNTSFTSLDDVMLWMIDNHLARRSVSDFQRGVLALRKKEIVAARSPVPVSAQDAPEGENAPKPPMSTREEVAKAARLSSNQISQIEKIQKAASPELVEAVRSGTISINAAATVASLPPEEQVAAVAGGKQLLRQRFQAHGFRRDADAVHGDVGADPAEADGGNGKNRGGGVLSFHGLCSGMSCAAVILPGHERQMV